MMAEESKRRVSQIINSGSMSCETIQGSTMFGNARGLRLAERLASFDSRLEQLASTNNMLLSTNNMLLSGLAEISAAQKQLSTAQGQLLFENHQLRDRAHFMEDRIMALERSSSGGTGIRQRFISTAKREVLGTATPADYRIIKTTNLAVHGGSLQQDVALYTQGDRTDNDTFQWLYGVSVDMARNISKAMGPPCKCQLY